MQSTTGQIRGPEMIENNYKNRDVVCQLIGLHPGLKTYLNGRMGTNKFDSESLYDDLRVDDKLWNDVVNYLW